MAEENKVTYIRKLRVLKTGANTTSEVGDSLGLDSAAVDLFGGGEPENEKKGADVVDFVSAVSSKVVKDARALNDQSKKLLRDTQDLKQETES